MDLVVKAIQFAAKAHDGQYRKNTVIPYFSHPYAVGMMLQKARCRPEVVAGGILHDIIEDTTITYEQLCLEFGKTVADIVRGCSEQDKKKPWEQRKAEKIEYLKTAPMEVIQVTAADKLHNISSILEEYEWLGDAVWEKFNRGKEKQAWYYQNVLNALKSSESSFSLIKKLDQQVKRLFSERPKPAVQPADLLFQVIYETDQQKKDQLEKYQLAEMAEKVRERADALFKTGINEKVYELLSGNGIRFETNSEGTELVLAFCTAFQEIFHVSDEDLVMYVKRNAAYL